MNKILSLQAFELRSGATSVAYSGASVCCTGGCNSTASTKGCGNKEEETEEEMF